MCPSAPDRAAGLPDDVLLALARERGQGALRPVPGRTGTGRRGTRRATSRHAADPRTARPAPPGVRRRLDPRPASRPAPPTTSCSGAAPPTRVRAAGRHDAFVRWESGLPRRPRGRPPPRLLAGHLAGDLPVLRLGIERAHPARPWWAGPSPCTAPALAARVRDLCAAAGIRPRCSSSPCTNCSCTATAASATSSSACRPWAGPTPPTTTPSASPVNMLPVRHGVARDVPFTEFVRDLTLVVADGLDHAAYPFRAWSRT